MTYNVYEVTLAVVIVLAPAVYFAWLGWACTREFRQINEAYDLKRRMELDDFIRTKGGER